MAEGREGLGKQGGREAGREGEMTVQGRAESYATPVLSLTPTVGTQPWYGSEISRASGRDPGIHLSSLL